jgi:hypothetical protein
MPTPVVFTVDEIIATLNHSSLPTVVAEGSDDAIVLRRIEDLYAEIELSLLFVGGRKAVLGTFDRRGEITAAKRVAFIADRDLWVLTEIPAQYLAPVLLFTAGYSIENDIYQDGDFEALMNYAERGRFNGELEIVVGCFSLAASRCLAGREGHLRLHPNAIIDDQAKREEALRLENGEIFPEDLRVRIIADYKNLLRGKTLIGLLMRQISYAGRGVRHNYRAMFEMAATKPGPLLTRLFDGIGAIFDAST